METFRNFSNESNVHTVHYICAVHVRYNSKQKQVRQTKKLDTYSAGRKMPIKWTYPLDWIGLDYTPKSMKNCF